MRAAALVRLYELRLAYGMRDDERESFIDHVAEAVRALVTARWGAPATERSRDPLLDRTAMAEGIREWCTESLERIRFYLERDRNARAAFSKDERPRPIPEELRRLLIRYADLISLHPRVSADLAVRRIPTGRFVYPSQELALLGCSLGEISNLDPDEPGDALMAVRLIGGTVNAQMLEALVERIEARMARMSTAEADVVRRLVKAYEELYSVDY